MKRGDLVAVTWRDPDRPAGIDVRQRLGWVVSEGRDYLLLATERVQSPHDPERRVWRDCVKIPSEDIKSVLDLLPGEGAER